MAAEDRQPADIVEGATTAGDVEDEAQPTAKSAEDRKAAAALSKLDARGDDEGAAREVDQEAVKNAMNALGGGAAAKKETKVVKVDAADVKLLVDELELPKSKATELLRAHDGDAVLAMKAYLQPGF
ncbi:hypothetical protein C8A05DRAFT_13401 [Staphylotrichum tortipilum]|uniref:Nascent polypeptide-associated complex subunit alpha-like UBA domain-containing protein n=1 Tax=Staphylotrichum tortipilum TaxID=2831512 RepID=A0AAN6RW77_9PEZI|nr:hypothetical protein C8A05DRAFT_13401 [Staphylotrichum longicolle]